MVLGICSLASLTNSDSQVDNPIRFATVFSGAVCLYVFRELIFYGVVRYSSCFDFINRQLSELTSNILVAHSNEDMHG